jgi:hypothetical protein
VYLYYATNNYRVAELRTPFLLLPKWHSHVADKCGLRFVFWAPVARKSHSNPTHGMDVWCVYEFILFVLSCVLVAALRRADHSSEESYRVKNDYGTEIRGLGPEWAGRAIGKKKCSG